MKRRIIISILVIICILIIFLSTTNSPENAFVFNENLNTYQINGIVYTKEELIEKCFKIKLTNSSYISEFKIDPDCEESYVICVKINIPENEKDSIFNYYDNIEKLPATSDDFNTNLFSERGVNKDNFDSRYWLAEKAERNGVETQRSTDVIFTKAINGKVTVYLFQDHLGWN